MKNYKTIIAAVAAGLACTAATSQATLTPVVGVEVAPTTYAPASIVGFLNTPYVSGVNPAYFGTFISWVIAPNADALASANGYHGLTFVFQANPTTGQRIESISVNGFIGDYGYNYLHVAGSTSDPSSVDQNPEGVVKANWPTPLGYQGPGDYIYLYSNAKLFGSVYDSVQDGSSATPLGLGPVVPEPSTVVAGALMLLPFGIGAIRSLRKDRTA